MKKQYLVGVRTHRAKNFQLFMFSRKKDANSFAHDCEFKGGCEVQQATLLDGIEQSKPKRKTKRSGK